MATLVTDDDKLNCFLQGRFAGPEQRVNRQGVPDYRPALRVYRSPVEIMAAVKAKVFQQARIQIMARKFRYTRISDDQIRLLRVKPGTPDDPLECDLSVARLADMKGRYEALSYCWGNDPATETALIQTWDTVTSDNPDSKSQGPYRVPQKFPIRPNLFKALVGLRLRNDHVVLWVDAICIDQREEEASKLEKNQQLSMMSEIYNSAKNVCIWLGDADVQSKAALKFVSEIMNFSILDTRLDTIDDVTKEKWCNLVRILDAPWFSRRWIIQEIASARQASVHLGDDIIHWDDLSDAIEILTEHHDKLQRKIQREVFARIPMLSAVHLVKSVGNVCRKSPTGDVIEKLLDLETLVCTFQQFHASFSEDIIHSVRALARDAPAEEEGYELRTTVEHQKSTRDLFIAFVNRCIMNSGSLDIICRHWAPPATDTVDIKVELPSWISELSKSPYGLSHEFHERQNGENLVAISAHDKRRRYNACGDLNHFDEQAGPDYRPRKSSIVPAIALNRLNPNVDSRILEGDVLLSPMSFSVSDPEGQKTFLFPPARCSSTTGEVESKDTAPTTGANPAPKPIVEPSLSAIRKTSTNSSIRLLKNSETADSRSGNKRPHIADVVQELRNPKRQKSDRASATVKQDSYSQEDKEHNERLNGTLLVHGLEFGIVKSCSDVMRGGIVPGDWLKKLGWDRRSKYNRVPDSVWRTLVADRNSEGGNPPGWFQRACLHCLNDKRITNASGDLDSHKVHKVSETMTSKYLSRVENVTWRRRIVEVESVVGAAESPMYGLAPEHTTCNDIICILFGCSVPVVLRKRGQIIHNERSEDVFEVVGESYIHGKMDGEAVQDVQFVRKKKRKFFLC